jgi:hypothetical protein
MNAGEGRALGSRVRTRAESLKSGGGTSIIVLPFDFLA